VTGSGNDYKLDDH